MFVQVAKVTLCRLYGLSLHNMTDVDNFVTVGKPLYQTKVEHQASGCE